MSDIQSRGSAETQILRANITDQLNRLLTQLEDLDELRAEFSPAEYEEIRTETLNQLHDFQAYLASAIKGDLTLIDEFSAASLALQQTVSQAFKTPEVIRLFALKQPQSLRDRLSAIHRDYTLNKLNRQLYLVQTIEILLALKSMGVDLSGEEQRLLDKYGSNTSEFDLVNNESGGLDEAHQQSLLHAAKAQITQAHK